MNLPEDIPPVSSTLRGRVTKIDRKHGYELSYDTDGRVTCYGSVSTDGRVRVVCYFDDYQCIRLCVAKFRSIA